MNGARTTRMKVAKGTLPQVVGPIRAAFYEGTGPVNKCDGAVATVNCFAKPGSAKCSYNY